MQFLQTVSDAFVKAMRDIWMDFSEFLPNLVAALIIIWLGWYVASLLGNLVMRILGFVKIQETLDSVGVTKALEKVGARIRVDEVLGWLVKWFFVLVFLKTGAAVVQWEEISLFLDGAIAYIPNIVIAIIILIIGLMIANFVKDLVYGSLSAAKFASAQFVATLSRWTIIIVSVVGALIQIRVIGELSLTILQGIVFTVALSSGLAFGLAGKERAGEVIEKLYKDLTRKEQ